MKVFVVSILCALVGSTVAGAIRRPVAVALYSPLLKTVVPATTKTTSYPATQYISALPISYAIGALQQFAYQVPQANSFAPLSNEYYSLAHPSYTSSGNMFYSAQSPFISPFGSSSSAGGIHVIPNFPSVSPSPSLPAPPRPTILAEGQEKPAQTVGHTDSDVVHSVECTQHQKNQSDEPLFATYCQPLATESSNPAEFPPLNTFPNFPSILQIPYGSLGQSSHHPQTQNSQAQGPQFQGPQSHFAQSQGPQSQGPQSQGLEPLMPPSSHFPQAPQFPQDSVNFIINLPSFSQQPSQTPSFHSVLQIPQKPQELKPPILQRPQIPLALQNPPENQPVFLSISQFPQEGQAPSLSSNPQFPQIPQISQASQNPIPNQPVLPSIPHFPQEIGQAPFFSSNPQFPQIPQIPQASQNPTPYQPIFPSMHNLLNK